MKAKKYYIEFVGPHAAGKTTIIYKIVDEDLLAPCVAVQPYKLYRSAFHFACSVPILAARNTNNLLFVTLFFIRYATFQWTNVKHAWQYLIKMVILHPYYERYNFDIWLKDDMLHILPHIVFRDGVDVKKAFHEFFVHFAHLYDGIIYIDVPRTLMLSRSAARHSKESARQKEIREAVFERAFDHNDSMQQMLAQQKEVPSLFLDGTESLEVNVSRILTFIKEQVVGTSREKVLK